MYQIWWSSVGNFFKVYVHWRRRSKKNFWLTFSVHDVAKNSAVRSVTLNLANFSEVAK